MRLYHYSRFGDLDKKGICPRYHGQGIAGAESKRKNKLFWIDRSYFGTSDYKPETGLGKIVYTIEIDDGLIYDLGADKFDLRLRSDSYNHMEALISAKGYIGYTNTITYPEIVAIFSVLIPVQITPEIKTKARW